MRSFPFDPTRLGFVTSVFALCLAQAHVAWATQSPAGAIAASEDQTEAVSTPEPTAAEPPPAKTPAPAANATSARSAKAVEDGAPTMTVEDIQAAMAAAEQERQRLLEPDPGPAKDLVEKWGVQVIGISSTAGGYMLDFRFQVVDAGKALPLFDHRIQPYVVAAKADVKLPVPVGAKVGAFRPTNRGKNIRADKTYYMIFANPDNFVQVGDKVSVIIGDFRAENLTVN
jgi:hypothetical protein